MVFCALFFVLIAGNIFLNNDYYAETQEEDKFSFGGPFESKILDSGSVVGGGLTSFRIEGDSEDSLPILGGDSLKGNADLFASSPLFEIGIRRYKVQKGDTLSLLADKFNISVETIRWANPTISRALRRGEELVILPVTGILLDVREGDSLESLARQYQVDQELVKQYNADYQKILAEVRGTLILPYAKPLARLSRSQNISTSLPDLKNYFVLPATGWNWGELHNENAVDIANKCGTSVYASQEGLVIPDEILGDGAMGWNNGYGIFVLVEHPNGTKTRYAHLSKALVKVGDLLSRSDRIGLMGSTGNSHGPSGCHLHFEILGAKNPFSVK